MQTQEMFDTVVGHLLKQNKQSMHTTTDERDPFFEACMYRSDTGLKCAVGCLIPDDLYTANIEAKPAWHADVLACLPWEVTEEQGDVLNRLQSVHDNCEPAFWPQQLKEIAEQYGLEYNGS